jgi:hypothetical protein
MSKKKRERFLKIWLQNKEKYINVDKDKKNKI